MKWRAFARRSVLSLCGAALLCCSAPSEIHESVSPHGRIIVTEDANGLRTLMFDRSGARQSVVKPGDPAHLELPYARAAMVGLALRDRPRRMLVVGLGGGSLPLFLRAHFPESSIDVVDIDPAVVDVARRFFGFREDELLRVHVADGRHYIESSPAGVYDLVFLDAFSAENIPAHLTTVEFLRAVRRAVDRGGVVVGNVWGPSANPLHDSMLRTYQEVFDELVVLDVAGDVNRIFLALPERRMVGRDELARLARQLSAARAFRFDLGEIVLGGYAGTRLPGAGAPVLRDP